MIVGVDVSSRRIDLAYLNEEGRPQRWHQVLEGKHLIDRLRSIRIDWPGATNADGSAEDTHEIAIEYPFGRSRAGVAALMSTVGIITRQAPPWARVAWPSSGELRTAIGAKNTKVSAHETILRRDPELLNDWDEHELDALVACIGWTRILAAQDAE